MIVIDQAYFDDLRKTLSGFMENIASTFQPIAENLSVAFKGIHDAIYLSYLEAGAPYGETDDGMYRWLKEVNEIYRMKREIERIRSHHEMLATLRQKVKKNDI